MDRDPFELEGDVLDGQFRVDSFAGEGDLSVVYKGHHVGVDAPVAIKCLNLPATLDPVLARPLVEGFKEASRLHYRLARGNLNIAQVIASGSTLAPRTGVVVPYLVREWFEGESLASELARRRAEKRPGRLSDETLALLTSAFDGIAYAHEQRELHLSINPSNLFVATNAGRVVTKVLDFGVARTMNDLASGLPCPPPRPGGLRLLFPTYAAPEQFDRTAGDLGPWTDVYSLALVVMEVLSDRLVMADPDTGALVARALDPRRRPTPHSHGLRLPRDLDAALARAVELSPSRRQQTAAELWRDIREAARTVTLRPTFVRSLSPLPSAAVVAGPLPAPAALMSTLPLPPPPVASATAAGALGPPPQRPRAHTLAGVGSIPPTASNGPFTALPATARAPSLSTRPLAFEAVAPSAPALTGPATGPLLRSIVPASTPSQVPARASPLLALAAATGVILCVLLVAAAAAPVLWIWLRSERPSRASRAPATSAPAPAPSSAPVTEAAPAPPSASPAPALSDLAAAPAPTTPFSAVAAKRALGAVARDASKCRRGKKWGGALTTVTFSTDGAVDRVTVGPPLAGSETAACVADVFGAVHVDPFVERSDKPAVVVYRVFVAR